MLQFCNLFAFFPRNTKPQARAKIQAAVSDASRFVFGDIYAAAMAHYFWTGGADNGSVIVEIIVPDATSLTNAVSRADAAFPFCITQGIPTEATFKIIPVTVHLAGMDDEPWMDANDFLAKLTETRTQIFHAC